MILYTNLKIKLFISFIIIFTTAFFLITNEQTIIAETEESNPPYKFKPSPDAKRFLGIGPITTSGYTEQPKEHYYIILGEKLHIETNVERTPLSNFLLVARYHWWQSTDSITWNEVDKKSNGNSSLDLIPTTVGKTYYQLSTSYVIPHAFIGSIFYSKVATVDVEREPISAKNVKVHTKADYLFNIDSNITRGTTFAYSTSNPFNATESTKWSVDKPDLATVNGDGHISANTNGKSGIVKVTGTINNKDNTIVSDSKEITVGNGLIDRTAHEGKKARFEIQGLDGNERDDELGDVTINWYKQVNSQQMELVKSETNPASNDIFYETHRVHPEDNNSKYYAEIVVKQAKSNDNSVLIGPATLTVLPPNDPKVEISSTITNKTLNTDYSGTQLNEVIDGDELNYNIDLYNNSKRDIHDAYITLPLHLYTQIEHIKVDDAEIDNSDYLLTTNEKNQILRINLNDFIAHHEKNIFIEIKVKNIHERESFDSQIDFHGLDPDSDEYTSQGNKLNINYINNQLTASVKDLHFEPITLFTHNNLKYRISANNDPNEVISIDDQRRKRRPLKLFLKQESDFENKDNKSIKLPADLRYYNGDSFTSLTNKTLINETTYGQIFNSIKWHKNQGPLLHINNSNPIPGDYSSKLTWQFEDSIT
ncbi:hypothetical protein [Companilactobacillus bobalius]|uniref:Uncharacterized protein n=1 Tax=Companilactobacillus bobalius TaxID=2801451 RepID=A0A202FDD5_9LACO|nr:hypothetical protein [Companilactobacillus bobalius]KAE9556833.1 hypothetical protein ATN92_16265 [Companilactobacillus bobalius]OVE98475.1 hypothetical protein LKACC16343_00631 [Companilactobacillus bobalius]GEO58854.1 hypothetical protein LBO01_19830 [Companilactobacillus paralimentarius]